MTSWRRTAVALGLCSLAVAGAWGIVHARDGAQSPAPRLKPPSRILMPAELRQRVVA